MGIRVLVLGAKNPLGHTLGQHAKPALLDALRDYVGYDHEQVDMANPDQVCHVLKDVRPDVVINAAAYTAMDDAEDDPDMVFAVNAKAVGVLAEQAKKQGCVVVHYSTECVFDGTASLPYLETDAMNPLSVYGRSQAEGEKYLLDVGGHVLIFRSSWIFAQRGGNFCKTMIKAAREGDELRVVDDQVGVPTPANFLAELGLQVAGVVAMGRYRHLGKLAPSFLPDFPKELPLGEVFHASAAGETTWYDYACMVLEQAHKQGLVPQMPNIQRAKTAELNLKAPRPAYSVLNNSKLIDTFRVTQPNWMRAVRNLVQALPSDIH